MIYLPQNSVIESKTSDSFSLYYSIPVPNDKSLIYGNLAFYIESNKPIYEGSFAYTPPSIQFYFWLSILID